MVEQKLSSIFETLNNQFGAEAGLYDRENIFYFKRDTGEKVNMLPFLPTATVKVSL